MNRKHEQVLDEIAHDAMRDKGLEPDFGPDVQRQLAGINGPARDSDPSVKDLRSLAWCSIDNDDSRDLDQLTWAETLPDGNIRVLVAVADVDAVVKKGTPIDRHAETNTTSVYTAAKVFSMLPEKLSFDLTSLNEGEERVAMIIDITVASDGSVVKGDVYRGLVQNKAKLAYDSVAAWLDGKADAPEALARVEGLEDNLRLQDRTADALRELRHEHGALDLETIEARPVIRDGQVVDLAQAQRNNARMLIEDFMIAANGVTARFLGDHKLPSIRRVVRSPERWDRIEKIAEELGERLPPDPDAPALEEFLRRRKKADPTRFPDLSLAIVKAMGAGEYVVEAAGAEPVGHFGLAVKDYTHSTAPNRRFPDLITHRMIKAALANAPQPYTFEELGALAEHCTKQEDAANKVERQVRKSAAAMMLGNRIGERFDGIVTGASAKGTWVRIFHPPVEGKVVHGAEGLDIGDRVKVKLVGADAERGFIDFVK
ncbi:MAG: RNB domain-containing ribonuclease [Acidobacteria bacterium]|nr:RNB domain-containing ribonuclease [Acidobacteriota bacterium]MBV9475734.1 RNB domain-containing ribonuclease [Acidobacteriota bacterium]